MLNLNYFTAAAAALTLVSGVNAGSGPILMGRNQEPSQPSCTNFTPFKYAGCFKDLSAPRALLFSGPNTQNMTVETCVAFCKGNDYEYAGLEYYTECFCGASVNGPQVDESYCSFPCGGNQSETCGGNDYINIYQDTTFPTVNDSTIADYKPMGCYSEGTNGRSLAWRQDQLSTTNLTVEECLFACKDGGYDFAGVEFGQECYCGVVLGNGTLPLPSSQCNMPCTGDSSETCGGPSTLDLYVAKDLESTEPCNGGGSSSSSSSVPPSTSSSPPSTSSSKPPTTSSTSTTSSTPKSSSTPPPPPPTTSCTTTSKPPPPTTSTTKTTASLCTSTYTVTPTPTCEYKCGSWCSTPLPTWSDKPSCLSAVANCEIQVASCFLNAGWPGSLDCFSFSSWCSSVSTYCGGSCPGGSCSKSGCTSKYPPSGPSPPSNTYSTSVYTCPPASTPPVKPTTTSSKPATSTSCVPVPTNSNICTQPNNPGKGYTSSSPVGNIPLPCLTCNNVYSDYQRGNCFKLYSNADTNQCPSYGRSQGGQGCKAACDNQYNTCMNTYAQGCKSNTWNWGTSDTYSSASTKCYNQWNDCYSVNSNVNTGSRCGSWNSGWY
ncbi:WSC-domain-containing protein [Hyaloscypha variabilis F]|uniref:WSC-domain-containing protein n=1 Tax=Hyaloscypha variabilis (strain UAMH 11265 / GT02V1 / F) TaxID=1149755 RepID=A0A2J6R6J8_HYAVF|nr:WSC-domain-containing protein [Hyaloscypha variabilis F]